MSRMTLACLALAVALCGCGDAPADDVVAPGATVSYVTDAGRAEVEVKYPETGVVRGVNRFRFRSSGATVTSARATMPAHGHHSYAVLGRDGDAVVADVELTMPGSWELTVRVATTSGDDSFRFSFVVP